MFYYYVLLEVYPPLKYKNQELGAIFHYTPGIKYENSHRAFPQEGLKLSNIACDVTVETKERKNALKIICADRVSIVLTNDANLEWHMPIFGKICHSEQKYMPFFGTVTERDFWNKNPKHGNV